MDAPAVPPKRPPFEHHVVICQGTSCTEKGQGLPARELRNALYEEGLQERVRVTRATCLNLCALSPNCVIYAANPGPAAAAGGMWYCGLTPSKVRRIVGEHLKAGHPPQDLVFGWDDPAAAV
jgi:(2Fe-2S) ferredoxin